jgi:transposase
MIRRKKRFRWTKALYRERYHVERFFNKLKQFRRIATGYDKLGASFRLSSSLPLCESRSAQLSP